jgi:hypothetical protein
VLDIVPTGDAFRGASISFAMDFWVWFFLAQHGPSRANHRR